MHAFSGELFWMLVVLLCMCFVLMFETCVFDLHCISEVNFFKMSGVPSLSKFGLALAAYPNITPLVLHLSHSYGEPERHRTC